MQRQLTVKEEICVQQQVSSKYVEPDETKNWPKPGRWTKHMKQQCKELLATPAQEPQMERKVTVKEMKCRKEDAKCSDVVAKPTEYGTCATESLIVTTVYPQSSAENASKTPANVPTPKNRSRNNSQQSTSRCNIF